VTCWRLGLAGIAVLVGACAANGSAAETRCEERVLAETLDPTDSVMTGEMARAVAAALNFRGSADHPSLSDSEKDLGNFRIVVNLRGEHLSAQQIGLSFTPRAMEPPVATASWRGFVYIVQKPHYAVVRWWEEE